MESPYHKRVPRGGATLRVGLAGLGLAGPSVSVITHLLCVHVAGGEPIAREIDDQDARDRRTGWRTIHGRDWRPPTEHVRRVGVAIEGRGRVFRGGQGIPTGVRGICSIWPFRTRVPCIEHVRVPGIERIPSHSLGTGGGTRTLKTVRTADFESAAFAIPPLRRGFVLALSRGRNLARWNVEVNPRGWTQPISGNLGAPTRPVRSSRR